MSVESLLGSVHEWTDERIRCLVRRFQRPLTAYLSSLGCPPGEAEEFVQEGFVSLLGSRFEWRGEASASAYLRRTVRNHYLKSLRHAAPTADLDAVEEAWAEYERDDAGDAYLGALRDCLAGLSARNREVLRLRYGEAHSRGEIARALELSEGGVKSILLRCKMRLRDCIERRLA